MASIDISGLTFSYETQPLFKNFSFSSNAERILIQGPSGCGKTTLLKLIAGVLPGYGHIDRKAPNFLVLQSDSLAPWLSGRENIALFSAKLWKAVQVCPLFSLIERFVETPVHKLSYGQRRSIELIRVLTCGHPLLLLDEPLNFLDRYRRKAFLQYMNDRSACDSQMLITSHYDEQLEIEGMETFEFVGDPPISTLQRTE